MAHVPREVRRLVVTRARGHCEYCLLHEDDTPFAHQVDHIIAIRHGGKTSSENLALACMECNRYKGADLSRLDPDGGALVSLFHPRHHEWPKHFMLTGVVIVGLTPTGRATAALLRMNTGTRILERQALALAARYPPADR